MKWLRRPYALYNLLWQTRQDVLALHRKVDSLMSDVATVKQLVKDLGTETDNLAARLDAKQAAQDAAIQALKDQIAAGGPVTQADIDGLAVDLTAEVSRLQSLGADPANPIPSAAPGA
jgi:uncharacterized coiled-coil protein SlyX